MLSQNSLEKKISIVHLIATYKYGGIETMLTNIVNLQVKKAKVSIIIINNCYDKELLRNIDDEVRIIRINRPIGSINAWYFVKLNLEILRLAPNIVHIHNPNLIQYLVPNLRNKSVCTLHTIPNQKQIKYLKKYRQLYSISHTVHKELILLGYNSQIILNGIDCKAFCIQDKYPESFKIVQVGRLNHMVKGQDIAIEAMRILDSRGIKDISLDIIGEGESYEYLNGLVRHYNLGNMITFLGAKSQRFIQKNLKKYSLFIQPSRVEGFGLTVAEAIASNVNVLVSDQEGPMEIIENGKFGFHFETGDSTSLANKIEHIIHLNGGNDIKNRARMHILNLYDITRTSEEYLKAYHILIEEQLI